MEVSSVEGDFKNGIFDILNPPMSTVNDKRVQNMCLSSSFAQFLKYEWLYTPIERELFLNLNDFQVILLEHFRKLKHRKFTRAHWHCIRRMIGRPRRFSCAFMKEERKTINQKREQIQFIQLLFQNSHIAHNLLNEAELATANFFDKDRIPLRLSHGTAVCASIVAPAKGLYFGVIQHPLNTEACYNVLIDKIILANTTVSDTNFQASTILGNYMVPELDIFPILTSSTSLVTVSDFRSYIKSRFLVGRDTKHNLSCFKNENINMSDNFCDLNSNFRKYMTYQHPHNEEFGSKHYQTNQLFDGFPRFPDNMPFSSQNSREHCEMMSAFLASLAKSYRILEEKQRAVTSLRTLNDDAEMHLESDLNYITAEFQHKYATLILHLDELNRELKQHIGVVLVYITQMAVDYGMNNIAYLTDWRRRCEDEAFDLVNRLKVVQGRRIADESKSVLVAKLTSILTLLAHLQDNRMTNDELACIEKVFADIRQSLHPSNLKCFEQSVEQLISHIVLNLSPSILPAPQTSMAPPNYPNNLNS